MTNPCVNCLTFPICRNELIDALLKTPDAGNQRSMIQAYKFSLKRKCDLINQYFFETYMKERGKVHNVFFMESIILNDTFKILEVMHDSYPM